MTKLLTLLLLVVLGATTLSAQLPDSCSPSPLVSRHYTSSAKIIALRQMLGDSVWADSVYIPSELYNPVLQALSAVYNATEYPERDTVTKCLDIQAVSGPISPTSIILYSDTTNLWARKLYQGIFPTGEVAVDNLIINYQLDLTHSAQANEFSFFYDTKEILNTVALAALFDSIPGAHAESNSIYGDGGNIVLDTIGAGITLTYSVGWGDCPAGCIFERSWTFLVNNDCSVDFLGADGDILNSEVACSSSFDCTTEPLCLAWLQDSIQSYAAQHPDCQELASGIYVTLYQDINTTPVIGIHVFIGIDAAFTDFFQCNGEYIGSCTITIGGAGCDPESLSDYFEGDTIWTCSQPLPTPENCNITATHSPTKNLLSFQLMPNPTATGQVLVQADLGVRTRGRLTVFDVLGKAILEKTFEADQLAESLDLGNQKPGIYFVRLDTGKQIYTQKLLIVK